MIGCDTPKLLRVRGRAHVLSSFKMPRSLYASAKPLIAMSVKMVRDITAAINTAALVP